MGTIFWACFSRYSLHVIIWCNMEFYVSAKQPLICSVCVLRLHIHRYGTAEVHVLIELSFRCVRLPLIGQLCSMYVLSRAYVMRILNFVNPYDLDILSMPDFKISSSLTDVPKWAYVVFYLIQSTQTIYVFCFILDFRSLFIGFVVLYVFLCWC